MNTSTGTKTNKADLESYLIGFDPDEKDWSVTYSRFWKEFELRIGGRVVATGENRFRLEQIGRNAEAYNRGAMP
jgi:hypothetical protein